MCRLLHDCCALRPNICNMELRLEALKQHLLGLKAT